MKDKCRKCGKLDSEEDRLETSHLFPRAHAIMNKINPDKYPRVLLCHKCHSELHLLCGMQCLLLGLSWISKSEGFHQEEQNQTIKTFLKEVEENRTKNNLQQMD